MTGDLNSVATNSVAFRPSSVRGARVFVAGGAGFVGSAVVRQLLNLGAEVVAYDNYFHGVEENLAGLPGPLNVIRGDAREMSALRSAVRTERPHFIINCIGDTYVPSAYSAPDRFFDINVNCNLNLLRAAQDCSVGRFIYVSSTEVYGDTGERRITESQPLNPVNTYAVSKAAADRLCYTYNLENGLPVVIARIFNCYGPRETHPYVVPEIIAQFARSNTVCLGNLEAKRDFTFVDDTARALIALLTSPVTDGEVVNVGSDLAFSVEWLARTIAHEMGIPDPEIRSEQPRLRRRDIDCFRCDNAKLRKLTGWEPRVDIIDGLRRTIRWYMDGTRRWSWEQSTNDVTFDDGFHRSLMNNSRSPSKREVAGKAAVSE
jgi:nucleoside-diphosphate-sugar epimerase